MSLPPLSAGTLGLILLVLVAGCRGDGGEPEGVATPTSFAQCNHPPRMYGDGAAYPLAAHWQGNPHGYREAADRQVVDPRGDGILRFAVRVQRRASGALEITSRSRAGGGTVAGPEVDTGDDGWSFTESD